MVLCYSRHFLKATLSVIWDFFLDTNWDINLDANCYDNCDANWDANWDVNWDANQRQLLKWDANWDANWDVNWDTNWDAILEVNWDANQDASLDVNWGTNWNANQRPKQRPLLKRDANNAIKSVIPWKSVHFVQKMMKNTLKVIVDTKKEAQRDANHRFLLQ